MTEPVESLAEAFVGCIMVDHSILVQTALGVTMVPGKAGLIYQSMRRLTEAGAIPDFETLYLDPSLTGAKDLLMDLQERYASGANWEFYEKQLLENWRMKKLVGLARIVVEGRGTSTELTSLIEKDLLELRNIGSKNDIVPIESFYFEWTKKLAEREKNRGQIPGISWSAATCRSLAP